MADVKISELTAAEAATADDLVVIVDDPAGTPSTKKLTIAELATAVAGDKLPLAGGTMTGAIVFGNGGQNINVGSFDNSTGGSSGISLICAVGYELNWQGGHLSSSTSAGATNYDILCDSSITLAAGKRLTFGDATYIDTAPPAALSLAGGTMTGTIVFYDGAHIAGAGVDANNDPIDAPILCDSSLTLAAGKRLTFGDATYIDTYTAPAAAVAIAGAGTGSIIAGGSGNAASGNYSVVAGGFTNTAFGAYSSVVGGRYAKSVIVYSRAMASGRFGNAAVGNAQMIEFVLYSETSSAVTRAATLDGEYIQSGDNCAVIPASTTWAFTVKISAYSVTDNVGAAWTITGALRRNAAGSTVIVGTNTTVTVTESALSTATCAVVADATNNAIKVTVTGITSKTIRWVAHVTATQVSNT